MKNNDRGNRRVLSLKYRIAAIIFLLEAIMMAAVLSVTLTYSSHEARKQLVANEQLMLNLLAKHSRIALLTAEYDELQPYLEEVVTDPHVEVVLLADYRDRVVVSSEHDYIGRPLPMLESSGTRMWRSRPITNAGGPMGRLAIRFSHAQLAQTNRDVLNLGITIALTGMIIIAVVGIAIGFLLTRRMAILTQAAHRLAGGDLDVRTGFKGNDEVAIVGQAFDNMAGRVEENVAALRQMTDELEQRVERRTAQLAEARDEAVNANRSKSAFLANMSHEIRTPLTAIIGFSESLLESPDTTPEQASSIQTIIRSGKDLLSIINDILDLSKIEADKLEVERIPVEPCGLLGEVESVVSLLAQEKGLSFESVCVFPLPVRVSSDPLRLKQILLNLCNNAVKFTDRGSVKLTMKCERPRRQLVFTIADTGIGMGREQIDRLFQPFVQADSSTTRTYGGTGLGLHLSKRLAEKLGGAIEVDSAPGAGTTVTLRIDTGSLEDIDFTDAPPKPGPGNALPGELPPTHGRVLVAEDNPDNQMLLSVYLRKAGAQVTLVDNGREAVDEAARSAFDAVLMDMQMPVMDGLSATRELRRQGYKGAIIAVTANALQSDMDACLEAGSDEVITKPIDRAEFQRVLGQYLRAPQDSSAARGPICSRLLEEAPELSDLVAGFADRLPETLEAIRRALQTENWVEVRRTLHEVKGTSGNLGFEELHQLTARLEQQVGTQHQADLSAGLDEFERLVARIQQGIRPRGH